MVAPRRGERGGKKKRVQIEREKRRRRVKYGGQYEIGPRGGINGTKDQKTRRRNCGAAGLDKSVIDKRQSIRIEQSLTEARKNHLIIWSHSSYQIPVNTHTHTRKNKNENK